jgi:hypothetical protein
MRSWFATKPLVEQLVRASLCQQAVLQLLSQFRVTAVSKRRRKPNDCRVTHLGSPAKFCSGEKGGLMGGVNQESHDTLLAGCESRVSSFDPFR